MSEENVLRELPTKKRFVKSIYEHHGKTFGFAHVIEADCTEVFAFFRDRRGEIEQLRGDKNVNKMTESLYSDSGYDNGWRGGSPRDLFEKPADLRGFRQAQKEFQSSDLSKKIVRAMGEINARRRERCEYDGEWSYDNRWDVKPFNRSLRKNTSVKIVKLEITLSFSAGIDAETVNNYGSFVAAVTKSLEASGVLVELWINHSGEDIIEGNSDSFQLHRLRVKRTDEYLPVGQLVKVFSSNFMRRVLHGMIPLAGIDSNTVTRDNLGRPFSYGKVWECIGDTVHIYSVPSLSSQGEIVSQLTEFITGEIEEAQEVPKKKKDKPRWATITADEIPF